MLINQKILYVDTSTFRDSIADEVIDYFTMYNNVVTNCRESACSLLQFLFD